MGTELMPENVSKMVDILEDRSKVHLCFGGNRMGRSFAMRIAKAQQIQENTKNSVAITFTCN